MKGPTSRRGVLAGSAAMLAALALLVPGFMAPRTTASWAMAGGAAPATAAVGRSVVMILGSFGTVCTATAIARDLLLTAAHCVQPGADYKLDDSLPGQAADLKDITRIERHPDFALKRLLGHLATADVALLKLAARLPDRISPAPLGDASERVSVGDVLVVAGYGVTEHGAGRLDGRLRAASLEVTGQPGGLQIRLFDPRTRGETAGLGACTGDSGAPAFRETAGTARIIGVVSWSTGPKLTAGCGGLTGITPLARYRGWIVDTAAKLGSPVR